MTDSVLSFLIIGIGIPGIMIIIFSIIAARQKYSNLIKNRPERISSFTTSLAPAAVLKKISECANRSGYKVKYLAENDGCVILGDGLSVTSWGFFYPIYVTRQGQGTLVEVGIKSRFKQDQSWNPITSDKHEKCLNEIKTIIGGDGR